MVQVGYQQQYNGLTRPSTKEQSSINENITSVESAVQKIALMKNNNISETIKISSCCKVTVRPYANVILLVFSAIGIPKGTFSMSRVFKNYEANIIYLNCPNNTWYLDGVEGLGSSLESTICSLKTIIGSINPQKDRLLVTTGSSMGGYGAILYGCLLEASLAVGAGVEAELLIKGGATANKLKGKFDDDSIRLFNDNFYQLLGNSATQCFVYYGDNSYHDILCGTKINHFSNVKVVSLKNLKHPVSIYINDEYGWTNFIDCHIVNSCEFSFQNDERSNLVEYPEVVEILYKLKHLNLNELEIEKTINILNSYLEKTDNYLSSHIYNSLSLLYLKLKQSDCAYELQKKAISLNINNTAFNIRLALLCLNQNKYREVITICDRLISLHSPKTGLTCWEGFIFKAKVLRITEKFDESFAILKSLVEDGLPIPYFAQVYSEIHHLYKHNLINNDCISSLIAKCQEKYFEFPGFKREILEQIDNIDMKNTIAPDKQKSFASSFQLEKDTSANFDKNQIEDLKQSPVFFLVKQIKENPSQEVLYWNLIKLVSRKRFDISDLEIEEIRKLENCADDKALNKLIDYAIENVETRKSNYAWKSNYQYKLVSLGSHCLPRTIPTRWGLKYPKSMGELSHPFDLSVHLYETICQVINNDFEDYLNPSFLQHDINKIPVHTKYDVYFNHERGDDFVENNYLKLIEKYRARINNFYKDIASSPILFLYVNHKKENIFPSKLAQIVQNKFADVHHKFLYINTGQPNFDTQKGVLPKNMIAKHIPYPDGEYIWHHHQYYISKAGKHFELAIVNSIKQAVTNYFPQKTLKTQNLQRKFDDSLKTYNVNNLSLLSKANLEQSDRLKDQSPLANTTTSKQTAIKKRKPSKIQSLHSLGQIYETKENWSEAARCYRQIIGLNPKQLNAYIKLAKILKMQNKLDDAIATYQKAIEIEPDRSPIYAELARTMVRQQNIKGAIVNYQKAIRLQPEQPAWVYHSLGDILNRDGQIKNAIAAYQKAIEIAPGNSILQNKFQAANQRGQKQNRQFNQNQSIQKPNTKLKVIRGKNNWLFLDNDNNQINQQLSGKKVFSDKELFKWKLLLEQRKTLLNKYNIPYFFVVIPNKACVYPEYLPDNIKLSDRRCINQLLSYLSDNSFANIAYPLEILKQAKTKELPVYRLRDTHWTAFGAFIAYQYIMSKISQTTKTYILPESSIQFSQVTTKMSDLGSKLNIDEDILVKPQIINPTSTCIFNNQVVNTGKLSIFENSNKLLPKAVIFGDSFSTQLIKFLAESFSRMVVVWQPNLDYSIILDEKPDIVISEQVERFLVRIPDDLHGLTNQDRVSLKANLP